MSRSKDKSSDSDLTFVRAFHDALADAEVELGIDTSCELLLTPRKGVFRIVLTATSRGGVGTATQLASYSVDYPNSFAQTFSAALFQASTRFYHVVEQALMKEQLTWVQEEEPGA